MKRTMDMSEEERDQVKAQANWLRQNGEQFMRELCDMLTEINPQGKLLINLWLEDSRCGLRLPELRGQFRFFAQALSGYLEGVKVTADPVSISMIDMANGRLAGAFDHRFTADLFYQTELSDFFSIVFLFAENCRTNLQRTVLTIAERVYHGVPVYRRCGDGSEMEIVPDDVPELVFLKQSAKWGGVHKVDEPPAWMGDLFMRHEDLKVYQLFNFIRARRDDRIADLRTLFRENLGLSDNAVNSNGGFSEPSYLDSSHARFSKKLAASVRAWQAVTTPIKNNEKQALKTWLRAHAKELGLTDGAGRPLNQAIEDCSKIANWNMAGGATKTPGN